jgi:sugar phosphate isomerase/epimerase
LGAAGLGASVRFKWSKLNRVGLQLYTVRGLMERDFEGTLAAVAQVGYKELEFAGYFNHTPRQVHDIVHRHHLTPVGAHIGVEPIEGDWARALADAKTIGLKYLIVADFPENRRRTLDDWRRWGATMTRAGEQSHREGITLGYHNHLIEFTPVEGRRPMDVLLESSDPNYLKIEMDIGWITSAGVDPLEYFTRWPGRFPCVHVKDHNAPGQWTDVGAGTVDWPGILSHHQQAGIKHYFVEHDMDGPGDPMATIRASYQYMSRLNV